MASDSGDSNSSQLSTSTSSKGFSFRPSALSDVADKMWKKAGVDGSSFSGVDGKLTPFSLSSLSKLASAANSGDSIFGSPSSTAKSQFIFGKNISNRVAHISSGNANENSTSSDNGDKPKDEQNSKCPDEYGKEHESMPQGNNGVAKVSFDVLAATSSTITTSNTTATNGAPTGTTNSDAVIAVAAAGEESSGGLEASAAAYEAAKQAQNMPNLLRPVDVKTGEEDETNVAHASVKLYVYDTTKHSWTDRGLAIIRVNDKAEDGEVVETRIVVRLQGSLRVIVNTKLWPDMLLERVSPKRLRLSGTVEDSIFGNDDWKETPPIGVYLVSAGQSVDIDRLEKTLRNRLDSLKRTRDQSGSSSSSSGTVLGKKRPVESSEESTSTDRDQGPSSPKKPELDGEDNKET